MKAIFGTLSLLIALAIVAFLAKKNLQGVGSSVSARSSSAASQAAAAAADGSQRGAGYAVPGGMPGAVLADPNAMTVPQQSRSMQQRAVDNTTRALQQGVERNQRADR